MQKAWKPGDSKMPGHDQKLGGKGLKDTLHVFDRNRKIQSQITPFLRHL